MNRWNAEVIEFAQHGFVPEKTVIGCDKCSTQALLIIYRNVEDINGVRTSVMVSVCPNCGNRQIDVFTSKSIPKIDEDVLPSIGSFLNLQMYIQTKIALLEDKNLKRYNLSMAVQ